MQIKQKKKKQNWKWNLLFLKDSRLASNEKGIKPKKENTFKPGGSNVQPHDRCKTHFKENQHYANNLGLILEFVCLYTGLIID